MLRDRLEKLFGQEGEDRHFEDISKVFIDNPIGYGYASSRKVTITEGYGPSQKEIILSDVKSIDFGSNKYNFIEIDDRGTRVSVFPKNVPGYFDAEERKLTVGKEWDK